MPHKCCPMFVAQGCLICGMRLFNSSTSIDFIGFERWYKMKHERPSKAGYQILIFKFDTQHDEEELNEQNQPKRDNKNLQTENKNSII